jgi:hypothetical protein
MLEKNGVLRRSLCGEFGGVWRRVRELRASTVALLVLGLLAACGSDTTEPEPGAEGAELAVVVNSTDRSLTVFPVDDPGAAYTIGVAPEGSPVSVAVRGGIAVVPLGTYPFAAVVDLEARKVTHTVALPAGSGATGAAFLNDSIALVANSDLNTISPVNVLRGTAGAPIAVGVYPQAIVAGKGEAYVINGELENWEPARPGTITVIDAALKVAGTIALSGLNPGSAALGADGRLYVLNSGSWGAENGSLSVVDPAARKELAHHEGFSDYPGAIATAPGRVLVAVYGIGILEWNPATSSFTHGLDNPLTPGGIPPISALGFDSAGTLYVLDPGNCMDPGMAYGVMVTGEVMEVRTGSCPYAIEFVKLENRK